MVLSWDTRTASPLSNRCSAQFTILLLLFYFISLVFYCLRLSLFNSLTYSLPVFSAIITNDIFRSRPVDYEKIQYNN